ncbi:MAG TPA: hypothetical protein VFW90_00810 [Candidatus Saccharimonadales bacterium]|nr:hypothetical protein [Candidatus Saccharimonadales bacterium]
MKILKKVGLVAQILLVFLPTLLLIAPKASANPTPFSNNPFSGVQYTLKNGKITTTITNISTVPNVPDTNISLTFTDSSPDNTSYVYTSDKLIFCSSKIDPTTNAPATITLSASPSGKSIQGKLSAFTAAEVPTACADRSGTITIKNQDSSTGGKPSPLPAKLSYNGSTYKLLDQATPLYGLSTSKGSDCYGGSVIIANNAGTEGTAFLGLSTTTSPDDLRQILVRKGQTNKNLLKFIQGCYFGVKTSYSTSGYSGSISGGKLNAPTPSAATTTCDPNTQNCDGDDTSKCIADGHTSLEWIFCPILTSISKFTDQIINFFQSQLNFYVDGFLPNGDSQVKKAWTVIKDLASSILVIVMLIMVISQAAGGGPFDAYTVKKLLPRMVVAVIAMQLSWDFSRLLISWANDAGQGIGQLIAAPFGGMGNLDLPSLIHHLNPAYAIGTQLALTGLFLIIISTAALSTFIVPVLALIGFAILMAMIVGFAAILARNLLIVILVITSPLALLLWILPGQGIQGLWKKWTGNFTKLLMLFPVMMALIYGGRAVAWVAGNLGAPGILDYSMVLIGYFGPLLFLPKAFKWGGSWLSGAVTGINNSWPIKKGRESGNKVLMDWLRLKVGKNANDIHEDMPNLANTRFSNKRYVPRFLRGKRNPFGFTGKVPLRATTPYLLPTKRQRNLAKKLGKQYSGERAEEAESYLDDFSRSNQERGIPTKQLDDFRNTLFKNIKRRNPKLSDEQAMRHAQRMMDRIIPESVRAPGIAASKWGVQMLAYKAALGGDTDMLKAISRFHVQKNSLLELVNGSFLMPEVDPRTGTISRLVPYLDWSVLHDQAAKEPQIYSGVSGMLADGAPHNWPGGGATYKNFLRQAGFKQGWRVDRRTGELTPFDLYDEDEVYNPEIDSEGAELRKALGGHVTTNAEGKVVAADPDAQPLHRPYILWHEMDQAEGAFVKDLSGGGSRAAKVLDMIKDVVNGNAYEDVAAELGYPTPTGVDADGSMTYDIPDEAKEAAKRIVSRGAVHAILDELSQEKGVQELRVLGDKEIGNRFVQVLNLSGMKEFKDSAGRIHQVADITTGDDVLRIADDALAIRREQARQNVAQAATPQAPEPAPAEPEPDRREPLPEEHRGGGSAVAEEGDGAGTEVRRGTTGNEVEVDLSRGRTEPSPGVSQIAFNQLSANIEENTAAMERLRRQMSHRPGEPAPRPVPGPAGSTIYIQQPSPQPNDLQTPGGVILTGEARRSYENNPPTPPTPGTTVEPGSGPGEHGET